MIRGTRLFAVLVVLAMLSMACGARLSEEERQLAISGLGGSGGGTATGQGTVGGTGAASGTGGSTGVGTDAGGGTLGTSDGTGTTSGTDSASGTTGGSTGQAAGGADGGSGGSGDGGGGGGDTGGTDPGGGGAQGQQADTRAAPPGGNGGATDIGVTESKIRISNVSDISGAVPGLFADAQKAVQAYMARFASTEGTVYGRQIELVARDSKLDSNENRKQYLAVCQDSLAAVGSMSAFEQGAATAISDCGVPDLRTAAVNPTLMTVDTVYSADSMGPDELPMTEWNYWAEQHPEAIKKAAMLFPTADTTQYQTQLMQDATSKGAGYEWVYREGFSTSETNYAPFVIEMKNRGVRFVAFQGAYQMAVRLAETMRQQNFKPDVYALQSNIYTPDYIRSGGEAVEGSQLAIPSVLLEEASRHPELQEYARWLQQIDPNARPTGLGMYAWASAKLFIQALKDVGPEVTRQKLVDYFAGVSGYDANGLIPPQPIGKKDPADCVIIVEVKGGQFQRVEPPGQGMRCDNQIVQTNTTG